jgi:hypothetical protein
VCGYLRKGDDMNGMEMMLKSFGIDIEAIKAEMNNTIEKIIGGIKTLADRVEQTRWLADDARDRSIRIEEKLDVIIKELHITYSPSQSKPMIEHKTNGADQ